ncbi:MAG: hypothetical protein AB7V27_11560 [Candidatus Binatia bacterium]
MRQVVAVVGAVLWVAVASAAETPVSAPAALPTPISAAPPPSVRVVGATTPTAAPGTGTPGAVPVRPIADRAAIEKGLKAGKAVGPVITYLGITRADGHKVDPSGKNKQGVPVFQHPVGSGFMIVVEAKPGISNIEPGRSIFNYDPNDPKARPDLEIQVDRALGDGSVEVCDARRPKVGGIPAVKPANFAETPQISAALNDLACRFETFIESEASCTVNRFGDFAFLNKDSVVQFCMVVARSWHFQEGDTVVSVRLRDTEGYPGPVEKIVLRNQPNPTKPPQPKPEPTATPSRRRP